MGESAAALTPAIALDRFFDRYYRRRPVTATFTGVHAFDHALPDWSPEALAAAADEMRATRAELRAAGCVDDARVRAFPADVDLALADGFLDIQIAEHEGPHFYRGNPALWTGEAIFSIVSLVTRDFAPLEVRLRAAADRLRAIPDFLAAARRTVIDSPPAWTARALRECEAAETLFGRSLKRWLPPECEVARAAFADFASWLRASLPGADARRHSAGRSLMALLMRRGHWQDGSLDSLLAEARTALEEAASRLDPKATAALDAHPAIAGDYLQRFEETWVRARSAALAHDLVTWPDAPIRYVPIPEQTRDAAPLLYYLFYRSPAAFDRLPVHDYVVPPPPVLDSAITLNHVVHHGGIGHHVQNWNAYRSASRIGQVAAIDAASRIAMFSGGSLAEGWACYVCDLMEDVGFLTEIERVAQQQTRARLAARAVVDLSLHTGAMTLDEAARLYETRAMMPPAAAEAEAVKNSMFPGAAVMYWLGTKGIHDLRRQVAAREGAAFSLKRFHDRFLSYGAIPVPLISRLMLSLLLAAAGWGCAGTTKPGPTNDLLIVGYDREPDTLNRFSTHILEDIQTCVIEGLTITDEHMNVVPLLASEVPSLDNGGVRLRADGGMDVTWRLRPNVAWHDGTPHTSADVKFTVDAINDPAYNPESTDGFDRISSVDTPDPLTAIVHYKEVYAPYALQFVRGTLPRHILQGRDIDTANDYNRSPLGTGPYRVAEWKSGEYIRLERVPHYWRGKDLPKMNQVLFRFIPNTNTRINQLRSGEVHLVAMFPWDKHREVAAIAGTRVTRTAGNAYEHVTLNEQAVPAFRDVRVRRALMHAIDRELIVKTILDGLAPVTNGPIQPVSWAFTDDTTRYGFDPPRARQLLAEAGYPPGTLAFTLITQAGFAVRENVAQVLQQQFRDVGVDMKIELHDGTTISQLWFEGRFNAMLHWWQMPADPELTLFFAADRTPPAGRNINYFKDDELTKLVYAADRTVDQTERKRLLGLAQRRIADLLPELPLYSITKLDAIPANLDGFKGNPTNAGVFWNVHEWSLR